MKFDKLNNTITFNDAIAQCQNRIDKMSKNEFRKSLSICLRKFPDDRNRTFKTFEFWALNNKNCSELLEIIDKYKLLE